MSKWLGMVVVVLGASLVHANILSNGDFETGDATSWTVSNTDISATVEASAQSSFSSGTGGISFVDGSANSTSPYIKKTFAGQPDGYYRVSMDFNIGAIVNAPWLFDLRTDSSADNAFVCQIRHNNFELKNAVGGVELVADNLVVDTWYHVEIIIDSANDKWVSGSVTDGNAYAASWGEIAAYASSGQFNQMLIHDNALIENSSLMVDNIVVEETDTPSAPPVVSNGDFELGSAGWTLVAEPNGGSIGVDASAQSTFSAGTQGLKFVDYSEDSTKPYALTSFAGQTNGEYVVQFDFKLESIVNQAWVFNVRTDSSADDAFKFQIRYSHLELRDSADATVKVVDAFFQSNTWYHVEINVDSANDKFTGGFVTDGTSTNSWTTEVISRTSSGLFNQVLIHDNSLAGIAPDFMLDDFAIVVPSSSTPPVEDIEIGTIGIDSDGLDVFIDWLGDVNGTYTVQKKSALSEAIWSNVVEDIAGVDGAMTATNSLTSPSAFYRVIGQ